jgi:TonB-dependent SusC/RagA subfamily outer membrane receptor
MPALALYLLKLSVSLSIVWIFYQLFLRRLTFYTLNRWYLLGYTVLSFLIPLINIGPMVEKDPGRSPLVVQLIPPIGNILAPAGNGVAVAGTPAAAPVRWDWWSYVLLFIAVGAGILLIRMAARWLSLRRIRRQARVIENTGIRVYQVDEDIIPFSFGKAIYINRHLHTDTEISAIILHEYVHIRQQHTADILLVELIGILNWYNPFAWLLRYSVRQNLEFIADHQVLENGLDKKNYQYHLLKVVGEPRYRLANNFNFSSLKKRIIMMNKIRSARLHLLKFLFLLPLMAVLLVAFRDKYDGVFHRRGDVYVNAAGIVVDINTHQPLDGAFVIDSVSGLSAVTDARGFYRLQIPVKGDSLRVRIYFRIKGYKDDRNEFYFASVHRNRGIVADGMLVSDSGYNPYMLIPPYFKEVPEDPSYDDVMKVLKGTIHEAEDWSRFAVMTHAHPEVALFYTSEGKAHQIVILKSGEVEKYGYPNGPSVADMEKKYGPLPEALTTPSATPTKSYLARWEKISEQAEREFHTANPDALHIIFPGDSRVIAVPRSGKPVIYDMDNADPKERPSFEALYGKLPDCVSAPFLHTQTGPLATPLSHKDSVPKKKEVRVDGPARSDTVPVPQNNNAGLNDAARPGTVTVTNIQSPTDTSDKILFVLDGVPVERDWTFSTLNPHQIFSISVVKDPEATRVYGERGKNGVILITTKDFYQSFSKLHTFDAEHPRQIPLYFLDSVEISEAKMNSLNPDDIRGIDVLKGNDAIKAYGERARNGVLRIYLKTNTPINRPRL